VVSQSALTGKVRNKPATPPSPPSLPGDHATADEPEVLTSRILPNFPWPPLMPIHDVPRKDQYRQTLHRDLTTHQVRYDKHANSPAPLKMVQTEMETALIMTLSSASLALRMNLPNCDLP